MANNTAIALYGVSWLLRRRGRHRAGVLASTAATTVASVAGFLGGHLTYRRGVGVNTAAFMAGPQDWTPIVLASDLQLGRPVAARVDGVAVVAVGVAQAAAGATATTAVHVLEARCTHRGGPLHDGEVRNNCISCPWHDSRFDLATGAVRKGPASVAQPASETRRSGGAVEVRRRELGGLRANPISPFSTNPETDGGGKR